MALRHEVTRLDWEKAAKRDYVRDHGAAPSHAGADAASQPDAALKILEEKCKLIIGRFRKLSAAERIRAYGDYQSQIHNLWKADTEAAHEAARVSKLGRASSNGRAEGSLQTGAHEDERRRTLSDLMPYRRIRDPFSTAAAS